MADVPSILISSKMKADAIEAKAKNDSRMAEHNRKMAEFQAEDAIERGKVEEAEYRKQISSAIGSQRAALAAAGIQLDSGSALEVQEDTAVKGELDALTIRNNARREAFGYKTQALNINAQSTFDNITANARARSTLLTGGLRGIAGTAGGLANHYGSVPKKDQEITGKKED